METNSLSGSIINERYTLIDLIGQGGKSVVYKALDLELKRDVACKVVLPELLNDDISLKRFRQEAIAAKRLDHANINSVIDFGEWNGQPFMVMDLLEGISIDQIIERERIPVSQSLSIFMQVAGACAYAHSRNIIHRDLKPSNIILLENVEPVQVKIIDFGIAKIISENTVAGTKLTKTGDVFGSPIYMSPEQCMGQVVDERTDIYSLGILMYEILVGQPPLVGPTAMATIFMHTREIPQKFGDIGIDKKTSQEIEKIVFRCLAKAPKQRYQKMDDVRDALSKVRLVANSNK